MTRPPIVTGRMTLPRDPEVLLREHNRILRLSLADAAIEHHDRHIPWHFEHFAPAKYGYARRMAKYQRLKDTMGLPPLVSPSRYTSGRLRNEVRFHFRVTSTRKNARLIMRLPFKGGTGRVRLRPGQAKLKSSQEQVLARITELEAVAPDESRYLAKFIEERYAMRARLPSTGRKVVTFGEK